MNTEELIALYSPAGDMITIITCWIILFIIAKVLYLSKDRKFVFLKRSVHLILMGAGVNIAFYLVATKCADATIALFVLRDLYHFSFLCCLYCFVLYMKKMLDVKGKYVIGISYFTRILFCICLILEALSPITKFGFHLEDGKWSDTLLSPYNVFYVYSLLVLCVMLIFYSKRIIRPVRVCLISTEIVVVAVMAYQGYLNINTFSSFTYLMPVLVVMILLHSRPFDDKTGSLSSSSFESFIQQAHRKGIAVDYMVLKLYISMTDKIPDELGKVLNSFWHSSFKNASLFSLTSDTFILAIPREAKNGDTEKKMKKLIAKHFPNYYEQYHLPYKMVMMNAIDFVENVDDVLGILQYLLINTEENGTCIVDEKIREKLKQYNMIRKGLESIVAANDLEDPRVLVYCQPIRNMKTGKFDTAEALMRLSLPDIGIVMPGVFIELAEQYNYIHTLTKIMLNKVCRQIKELEEEGYIFRRVSVNFAASEIKADSFCNEVLEIVRSNDIDPSKIGIELTETQTERDFVIVKQRIRTLRDAGMTLYLDDVGTGYSNLDRIVRYDVDVVKFDRFFLLEAEKSNKVGKMLQHLSQAFRDLDYKLLYEGVETEDHEELCMNCGADYIQGFKYSKPVPMEGLRNFFSKAAR